MTPPLNGPVRDYYDGGSGDEITLSANEAAWRAVRFRPRVLRDVSEVLTGIELFGSRLASPVVVAPTALHALAHPDGEVATAVGTSEAGSLLVLSTRSSVPMERIAQATTGPWWFQVYAMRDRGLTIGLAERAAAAGARALVLTGDTPLVGTKKRPTPGLDVSAMHLQHMREQSRRDLISRDVEQDPSVGLAFIRDLQEATGLPVLVKGVLRADDAMACVSAGAAGVIVSNHGGRQLDRAVATAVALPEVVAAVGAEVPVVVDGGIRTGLDVLAAIGLGARAVMVGRPALHALAEDGAPGVTRLLSGLKRELTEAMTLAGARTTAEVTADLVIGAP